MNDIDDGELIDMVFQFRFLYDKKDSNFKDKVKRENAWQTISTIIGVTPTECEQRWSVLRNKYATLKRISKNRPSGSEAYTISWPYFDQMKFLDSFIQQRKTRTNYSAARNIPQDSSSYSGVHTIIPNENDPGNDCVPEEEISESFGIQDSQYDLDQSIEEDEETQALYESFMTNKKQPSNTPPAKKIKSMVHEKPSEKQHLEESQILHTTNQLAEIRRLRKLRQPKDNKSEKDTIVNKLGGCLNTFQKIMETKNTSGEDEDFVRSLTRDLSVFTPSEKISLKQKFYECMDQILREKET